MAGQWSYVWRGGITLASTVVLLNELSDEDFNFEDVRAIEAYLWGNALLWGPELFGSAITKYTGLKAVPAASSVALGYGLGVAATFAVIEATAPTQSRKAKMQDRAEALFLPQFAGGESFEELDYFGTLYEGGKVLGRKIQEEFTEPIIDYITDEIWQKQLRDPVSTGWRRLMNL